MRDQPDDGLKETERRHSANCRAHEAQRQKEAEILQAGYDLGRTDVVDMATFKSLLADRDYFEAQLAATHAAIRAMPRHSACQITDRFERWIGGDADFVLVTDLEAALARLQSELRL